jgi:hypothetical protein
MCADRPDRGGQEPAGGIRSAAFQPHPILGLIRTLGGNDFDDFDSRLYTYEVIFLEASLRAAPEALWAGAWREHELAWVRTEIAEMFSEGVGNAFALRPRLDAMRLPLTKPERGVIENLEADFILSFRQIVGTRGGSPGGDSTKLRRSLFLKTIFVLCLTTRDRPLLMVVDGGGRGKPAPLLARRGRLRLVT